VTEVFFIEGFSFSPTQREALNRLGLAGDVIAELEGEVAELKGYYAGQPLSPRQMRKHFETLHIALREFLDKLDQTDNLTLSVLNAAVLPKTGVSVQKLRMLLAEYGDAAQKAADHIPVHGPEASKDDHVARAVGEVLKNSGISLDPSEKGIFVIATGIVFEAMDIHRDQPRNNVRRALESWEKAGR
jgi:hypothetical protein